jgi:hypothetical protein
MRKLGLKSEGRNEKYLWLPVYVGQSKMKVFEYLKDRVWSKIQGWKEKMLSKAGKEVLIKACAQAIPMFAMACFDITKSLCDQISSMVCRYWWSYMQNEKKMHLISWKTLTLPKKDGGLGYKDLHSFTVAMLVKQGWRLLTNPKSLCARVLKAKYYPSCYVLYAQPCSGMSYTWRIILKGIELLNEGSSSVWEMGKLSIAGRIHGFLESGTGCPSLEGEMQLLQLLLNSLIPSLEPGMRTW